MLSNGDRGTLSRETKKLRWQQNEKDRIESFCIPKKISRGTNLMWPQNQNKRFSIRVTIATMLLILHDVSCSNAWWQPPLADSNTTTIKPQHQHLKFPKLTQHTVTHHVNEPLLRVWQCHFKLNEWLGMMCAETTCSKSWTAAWLLPLLPALFSQDHLSCLLCCAIKFRMLGLSAGHANLHVRHSNLECWAEFEHCAFNFRCWTFKFRCCWC